MNALLKVAHTRHPRYVHAKFQRFLQQQGLRAPIRKRYAVWLCRLIVFHHGHPPEQLGAHQVEHFLQFLSIFEAQDTQHLAEAHYCLRLFYEVFLPSLRDNASGCSPSTARTGQPCAAH